MNSIQNSASAGIPATPIMHMEKLSKEALLDEAKKFDTEIKSDHTQATADKFKSIYNSTIFPGSDTDYMSRINKSFMRKLAKAEGSTLGEIKEKTDAKAVKWNKVANAFNVPTALGGMAAMIGLVPTGFCMLGEIAGTVLWPAHLNGLEMLSPIFPAMMMVGTAVFITSLMAWNLFNAMECRNSEFSKKLANWGTHIQAQAPQNPVQQDSKAA